jgi:hypothetical protein
MKVAWHFEAALGEQDSYFASYLGTRSLVELRSGPKEKFVPEIYLTPSVTEPPATWEANLKSLVDRLQKDYPNLASEKEGRSIHLILPKADRSDDGIQALFKEFVGFIRDGSTFPEFENSNLLAKYYVTTTAVALANSRQ